MIGYVTWTEEKSSKRADEISILRMRFYRICVLRKKNTPAAILHRRASAAAAKLQKLGVTRAVFPKDFPYVSIFVKRGILPVEVMPLYRSLAGEWLRAELASCGVSAATIVVCGERLTGDVVRSVTEICLRYRYVMLDIPEGGEELARQLRREFGVSLQLRPTVEQISSADGVLLFANRNGLKNKVVLSLYNGAHAPANLYMMLPPLLEEKVPMGCRRDQLFAAMVAAGVLRPAQIELKMTDGGST